MGDAPLVAAAVDDTGLDDGVSESDVTEIGGRVQPVVAAKADECEDMHTLQFIVNKSPPLCSKFP